MLARSIILLTAIALLSSVASAAEISSVGEGALLNGEGVFEPGMLAPGDVVTGPATIKTAGEDTINIDAGSQVRLEPTPVEEAEARENLELFFVLRGSARGEIGGQTEIACSIGWLTAPRGNVEFYVEEIEPGRAFFRSNKGDALLVHGQRGPSPAFSFLLPAGNGIEIHESAKKTGELNFETQQGNPEHVQVIAKVTDLLLVKLSIPKATKGSIVQKGGRTILTSDATSFKGGKIVIRTEKDDVELQKGELGPGTFAQINNLTGVIEMAFVEINFEIIKRDISLTSEFSTLAVSNFSGLGKK